MIAGFNYQFLSDDFMILSDDFSCVLSRVIIQSIANDASNFSLLPDDRYIPESILEFILELKLEPKLELRQALIPFFTQFFQRYYPHILVCRDILAYLYRQVCQYK